MSESSVKGASAVARPMRSFDWQRSRAAVFAGQRIGGWGIGLALVTIVFVAANHLLLRGEEAGIWDIEGQFFPFFTFVADHARAGRIALWDPFSAGGLPVLGEPQIGVFSPLTTLVGLVTGGGGDGFVLYWLLMWWLGGLGMMLLARHLGVPVWVGVVVALGLLFSGVYAGNAEHTSWVIGFSALPFVMWRLDAALVSRQWLPAVQAGAFWGLSGLSAYPGLVILTGGMAVLWAVGRLAFGAEAGANAESAAKTRPPIGRVLQSLALLVGVGLLVLAPTYFAFFYEGAGTHTRVGALAREVALVNQFDPGALITLATPFPASLKAAVGPALFPSSDPSMTNIYMGVLVPVLAITALVLRPRNRWYWFLLLLAMLSLATAMGETLPLRGWLYDLLLPLRYFRHSAIFRLYFVFFVCVLAMQGGMELARVIGDRDQPGLSRFALAATGLAVIAVTGTVAFVWHVWATLEVGRRSMIHAAGWIIMTGLVLACWRLSSPRRFVALPLLLVGLAIGDALTSSVAARATVSRGGPDVVRWRALDARHVRSLDLTSQGLMRVASSCDGPTERCRANDQMIGKFQSFDTYTTQRHDVHQAMLRDPLLQSVAVGRSRVWFTDTAATVVATEQMFAAFTRRAQALGAVPLVVHTPSDMLRAFTEARGDPEALSGLTPMLPLQPTLLSYETNSLHFRVEAPRRGWLLVSDRWARSWRARVNGEAVPVYGGNFIFRAIPVETGINDVEFSYRPTRTLWLLGLSWSVLGGVLLFSIPGVVARRTSTPLRVRSVARLFAGVLLTVLAGCGGGEETTKIPPATIAPADWRSEWGVPEGFSLEIDADGFDLPTAIAIVPKPGPRADDPRYFVVELNGRVRVVSNDRTIRTFAEGFMVRQTSEQRPVGEGETGAAGICLEPTRGYVFVTFAYRDSGGVYRNDVIRFTGQPITFSGPAANARKFTETFAPFRAAVSHQVGGCVAREDGLFVTVGDGRQVEESRRNGALLGKVLRFDLDGGPLPSNPYYEPGAARRPAGFVWASGFRNPFGITRVGDRLFVADNGSGIDRFLEVRRGEDYLWSGTDWSIGARADAVISPSVGPAQMDYVPFGSPAMPPEQQGRFLIAVSGMRSPGVLALPYDMPGRRVSAPPEILVRYRGSGTQIVAGVAVGPDGVYFAPVMPDIRGGSAIYRLRHDPARAHPFGLRDRSAAAIITEQGCLGCHSLDRSGGTAAPALDRSALMQRLEARLASPEYAARVRSLDSLDTQPFKSYRSGRSQVLASAGVERMRHWVTYKLMDPRFDDPDAQMPDPGLNESEARLVAEYLVIAAEPQPSAIRRVLDRVLATEPRWRHVAGFALMGFLAGVGGSFALSRWRGRTPRGSR